MAEGFVFPTPWRGALVKDFIVTETGHTFIVGDIDLSDGKTVGGIIKMDASGNIDNSFSYEAKQALESVNVLSTGEIIVSSKRSIIKLNSSGNLLRELPLSPDQDDSYLKVLIQSEDKIVVSGLFSGIQRFLPDLTSDNTFNSDISIESGAILTAALQGQKIIIAGSFTRIDNERANRIARLDEDGNLDLSFSSGNGANSTIQRLFIQPDGKILPAGFATSYGSRSLRSSLFRVNSDGTLDTDFNPPSLDGFPIHIEFLNNRVYANMGFVGNSERRNKLYRFNDDGSLDEDFPEIPASSIFNVDKTGEIIAYNNFTLEEGSDGIQKYSPAGQLRNDFHLSLLRRGTIQSIDRSDDAIYILGDFSLLGEVQTYNVGKLDNNWLPVSDFKISKDFFWNNESLVNRTGGKLKVKSNNEIFVTLHDEVIKLNSDGTINTTFDTGEDPTGRIFFADKIDFLSNGKIAVVSPNGLWLLNPDGSLDTDFDINIDVKTTIYGLAIQSDDQIIYSGGFESIDGQAVEKIARLSSDGTIDQSFEISNGAFKNASNVAPIIKNSEDALYLMYNGANERIKFNNTMSETFMIKVKSDGSLDLDFLENLSSTNTHSSVLPTLGDGVVTTSGAFIRLILVNSEPILLKVNADGTVDQSFTIPSAVTISAQNSLNVPLFEKSGEELFLPLSYTYQGKKNFGLLLTTNSPPVLQFVPELTTPEETSIGITLSDLTVVDSDNIFPDDFRLLIDDGDNYTVNDNAIVPAKDFNGFLTVPVYVNDGINNSNKVDMTIEVTPINDAPVITASESLTTAEETSIEISISNLTLIDPDNTFPTDFILTVGSGDNYELNGSTITPAMDFNGTLTVPVSVNDGTDDSEVYNLAIEVTPVNDAPVITASESLTTVEETSIEIGLSNLTITDPDNDFPTDFTLSLGLGDNYQVTGSTITPDTDFNGTLTVTVSINDGTDDSEVYNLAIEVTPVNDVPVITASESVSTPEETSIEISISNLTLIDPDNTFPTDFILTVGSGDNYELNGSTITPAMDFNGTLTVPVSVDDGTDDSEVYNLAIEVTPVNDAPAITASESLTTVEETSIEISISNLTLIDPDNTFPTDFILTVGSGDNYELNGSTITPAMDFNGTLTVPVSVNDGTDDSEVYNLAIEVTPVNDAPVITASESLTTAEETSIEISISNLTLIDPDNDFPTDFILTVGSGDNYELNGSTITPAMDFNGTLTVPVSVNDGTNESEVYNLVVEVTAVNDAPVISSSTIFTTPKETPLEISLDDLTIIDPDNSSPDDFTLIIRDGNNYTVNGIRVIPDDGFNGTLTAPISVNDGTDDSNVINLSIEVTLVTGIENDQGFQTLSLFPNPTADIINISFDNSFYSQVLIGISDTQGKTYKRYSYLKQTQYFNTSLDKLGLPSGVYFVRITQPGFSSVIKKVIIK